MKKLALLLAPAAALALTACGDSTPSDQATDGTDVTVVEEESPAPTVTETAVVHDADVNVDVHAEDDGTSAMASASPAQ